MEHYIVWWPAGMIWLRALTAWLVMSLAFVWGVSHVADRMESQANEAAFERAEVGVEAIHQILERVLEAGETLHDLARSRLRYIEAGEGAKAEALEVYLKDVAQRGLFGVHQVAYIGRDGWLSWSSVPGWDPVDLSDRTHFRVHLQGDQGLFISEPLVGRASGRTSVQLSRRVSDRSGAFSGVVVVSVDALQLSQDLASLDFGNGASALITRKDGVTLARSRDAGHALTVRLRPDGDLRRALDVAASGRFRAAASSYDGRSKLVAYRAAARVPLVVAVDLDHAVELAPIAYARPLMLAIAAAFSLLTLSLLGLWLVWGDSRRTHVALSTAERERESMRERLAHTERMEALGRLAGGVAHDFNNVLQAILGGAHVIARRSTEPTARQAAGMIIEAAQRGASVTGRLLALSRRGELTVCVVDAWAVLVGLKEVLTHTLEASVDVRVEVSGVLPLILTDRGQLETVLVNLAVNARDAMLPQGGRLTISATTEGERGGAPPKEGLNPGRYLRIDVADTGPGMDAATLARAAEPFFTTKPKGQGTGLGLAMAKGFAEQTGGAFEIESGHGLGTTVTLWVPCADDDHTPNAADAGPALEVAPRASLGGTGRRMLLVDDDPLVLQALVEALVPMGWTVSVAHRGAQALTMMSEGATFDVLVTDLTMPGLDGLSLIRQARLQCPNLPALLMTGHAGDAHTERLSAVASEGPFSVLRKPMTAEALSLRAEMLVDARAGGNDGPSLA